EPSCHSRITRKLGLDMPQSRLAIPRFFLTKEPGGKENPRRPAEDAPNLSDDERNRIMERMALEAERRQRISAKFLRILVDGLERLRLDVARDATGNFEVQEGAKLIEIWTEDQGEAVLLATHWIEYTQWQGIARKEATVDLDKDKRLLIQVVRGGKST